MSPFGVFGVKSSTSAAMLAGLALACGPGGKAQDSQGSSGEPGIELAEPEPGEGFQIAMDVVAPAGTEVWKCEVMDLPLPETTGVRRVVSRQSPGVHHMDIMALSLLNLPLGVGTYQCADLYNTYPQMMEDGVFIYATQLAADELVLPTGVGAILPDNLRVMVEMHVVNASAQEQHLFTRVNAYTMPFGDVQQGIWGSAVRDVDINIPAGAQNHVEWTRCVMNRDVDLLFISSHTHQWGRQVEINLFDGTNPGQQLYVNNDWQTPALLKLNPPLHIAAGTGFEFRCHFSNATDAEVHWGFTAADEMCQIGFAHTPYDTQASCDVVASGVGP